MRSSFLEGGKGPLDADLPDDADLVWNLARSLLTGLCVCRLGALFIVTAAERSANDLLRDTCCTSVACILYVP